MGILSLGHVLPRTRRRILSTKADERGFFLSMSRIGEAVPGAHIHDGGRWWFRFLARHLTQWHFHALRERLGRRPYHDELVRSWYGELYAPAVELHRLFGITAPFPRFYRDWMTWRRTRPTRGPGRALSAGASGLRESLDAYLADRGRRYSAISPAMEVHASGRGGER